MAADMAIRGIREVDPDGTVAVFTMEPVPPYDRPPLSKNQWPSDLQFSDVDRETKDLGVDIFLNTEITKITRNEMQINTGHQKTYGYDRLLIATGGSPRKIQANSDEIIYFRTWEDLEYLSQKTTTKQKVGIVGGGYIGAELAATLNISGHDVEVFFPETTLLGKMLPEQLGKLLNQQFQEAGVKIYPERTVNEIYKRELSSVIVDSHGLTHHVDLVIAGLGIIPNMSLAKSAKLVTSDGIEVNEFLQTNDENIFAAGDVANYYCAPLRSRRRVEHEEFANLSGYYAGQGMAGELQSIEGFLPMFYTELFGVSIEGVGEVSKEMISDIRWDGQTDQGTAYFLRDSKIQGALSWNKLGEIDKLRELIQRNSPLPS